jgi:hypothetical protein
MIYSRLVYRYNSNNRLIRLPYCISCYVQPGHIYKHAIYDQLRMIEWFNLFFLQPPHSIPSQFTRTHAYLLPRTYYTETASKVASLPHRRKHQDEETAKLRFTYGVLYNLPGRRTERLLVIISRPCMTATRIDVTVKLMRPWIRLARPRLGALLSFRLTRSLLLRCRARPPAGPDGPESFAACGRRWGRFQPIQESKAGDGGPYTFSKLRRRANVQIKIMV